MTVVGRMRQVLVATSARYGTDQGFSYKATQGRAPGMWRGRGWGTIVIAALALPWCTGCPQMAITTAATTAASALVDDRSMEQQAADLDLKARIEKQLLTDAPSLAEAIDVDVYLGRVMLTGVVSRPSSRRRALAIVRSVAVDNEVFDDIQVASGEGLGDAAGDYAINKELGVNLLTAMGVPSQSFQHRVVNGTAFIMGEAKNPGQVETARQVALQTPGISRVVTHILVD
jgi:osmotically-inducible protein OsmY